MHVIYLHGFASSPDSSKARGLGERLTRCGVSVRCPDLNEPDFATLTVSRMVEQVERLVATLPVPVVLEMYDLGGRRVGVVFAEERGIGPVEVRWDGRLEDGRMVLPGTYVWVLRVRSDAFEEMHSGTLGVAY